MNLNWSQKDISSEMEQHRGDTNVWPTDPGRLQEWKYWFR